MTHIREATRKGKLDQKKSIKNKIKKDTQKVVSLANKNGLIDF